MTRAIISSVAKAWTQKQKKQVPQAHVDLLYGWSTFRIKMPVEKMLPMVLGSEILLTTPQWLPLPQALLLPSPGTGAKREREARGLGTSASDGGWWEEEKAFPPLPAFPRARHPLPFPYLLAHLAWIEEERLGTRQPQWWHCASLWHYVFLEC